MENNRQRNNSNPVKRQAEIRIKKPGQNQDKGEKDARDCN
jgi:hypothetical protein